MQNDKIPLMDLGAQPTNETDSGDVEQPPKPRALQAWKFTVASGAFAASLILVINVITLAVVYAKYPMDGNTITFFQGSCHTAQMATTAAHLVINILCTILLGYSNFSMQCLNAPTRREVDAAHAKHRWLNIGTPSIRNLFLVSKSKVFLWLVLGASSFPLHMIWNSVVFETKTTNEYLAVTVTENFTQGAPWTLPPVAAREESTARNLNSSSYYPIIQELQQQVENNSIERLSVESCWKAYLPDLLSARRHVVLVIDASAYHPTNPAVTNDSSYMGSESSILALYNSLYDPSIVQLCQGDVPCNSSHWIPAQPSFGDQGGAPLQYCYSQPVAEQCKANLVPVFLITVIVCNIIKTACFLLALRITRKEPPLCTIGDAIQSFLQDPDVHTQGCCMVSKRDYEKLPSGKIEKWTSDSYNTGELWKGGRGRWTMAVNPWQWSLYLLSLVGIISYIGVQIWRALTDQSWLTGSSMDVSFFPDRDSLIGYGSPSGTVVVAWFLLVNTPQMLISYIYIGLNNIMSTMLVMAEWCGYSVQSGKAAKGLRVSSPAPNTAQRSTYFLSVPYKWSIPTMISMTIVHWLVSEMFFFTQLDVYTNGLYAGQVDPIVSSNYILGSPEGMIRGISVGAAVCFGLLLFSVFKRFPGSMPLAGCCSASMAAACQPPRTQDETSVERSFPADLVYKKLKWGVVQRPDEMENGVGHATFTADEFTPLDKGSLYS